jgi:hypothetical protein
MIKSALLAANSPNYGAELTKHLGICSLSRDPLNLLMWAHYANNHRGFVVEFSIPTVGAEEEAKDYLLKYLVPLEVNYSKEKPIIDHFDDDNTNANKTTLTKGIDWVYEQEERVVDHIRGHGIHPYNRKRVLKSVIAGMRMDSDKYNELRLIIESLNKELSTNVTLYKAEAVHGEYKLHVPGRPDLQMKDTI